MGREYEGIIRAWHSSYGFIDFENGRRIDSVFYPGKNIIPNNIGQTGHAKIVLSPVQFRLIMAPHRGELRPTATEVTPLFRNDVPDPLTHREISFIERLGSGYVHLRRQTGEQLFLHVSDVLPEFRGRFDSLRVGDGIFHGVRPSTKNGAVHASWRAVAGELFSREEQQALCGN